MKVNKKIIQRMTSICAAVCILVSSFLISVSANDVIRNSDLSFKMAFAGSVGTGLNYKDSGFLNYTSNENYYLTSDASGTFSSDSYISSVYYIKRTDSDCLLRAGDTFSFSFSNFSMEIEKNGVMYHCTNFSSIYIDLFYTDGTSSRIIPDFFYDSTFDFISINGSGKALKDVTQIKLDFVWKPANSVLLGSYSYIYFMFYPPDVYLSIDSRESQILGDIDNKLDSAINGTPEQNDKVNSAVDQMSQAGDKLGSLGDSMSSIEKPAVDSIEADISTFVDPISFGVLTAPFLRLWENDTLLAILSIVVTLVIVSWVFFGKKK